MLYTAQALVPARQKVIPAELGMSLRRALEIMDHEKFSQLPVVDQGGYYLGMLSEHSIATHVYRRSKTSAMLDDTIDRWYADDKGISLDTDVYDVLEMLTKRDAVTIIDGANQPYGVITHYDTAQFYGTYAYGFMLIEYIERTLRLYIESAFPSEQERADVLEYAKRNPTVRLPDRYEDLTLRGYLDAYCTSHFWGKLVPYLGSRETFVAKFDAVPKIRNDAMHFRNEKLSERQLDTLRNAANFMARCLKIYPPTALPSMSEG